MKTLSPLSEIIGGYEILRSRSSKDWYLDELAEWLQSSNGNRSLGLQLRVIHAARKHENLDDAAVFRVDNSAVFLVVE